MRRTALIFGTLLLTAAAAPAQNISFLSRGPVAYLTDEEKVMLRQTFNDALDNHEDGETVEWQNPDSDHGGSVTVMDTHEDFGTTCRTVRTRTRAGGRTGGGTYRLCLATDDTWQFAPNRRQDQSE